MFKVRVTGASDDMIESSGPPGILELLLGVAHHIPSHSCDHIIRQSSYGAAGDVHTAQKLPQWHKKSNSNTTTQHKPLLVQTLHEQLASLQPCIANNAAFTGESEREDGNIPIKKKKEGKTSGVSYFNKGKPWAFTVFWKFNGMGFNAVSTLSQ
jgi:hypothetical protein